MIDFGQKEVRHYDSFGRPGSLYVDAAFRFLKDELNRPVKSRFGSRQIPSGVPSNSERGPVKFRAGSENFRTGPCQNPPPHKENSGNSRGIFRPGASFFRLKFPFPVFSALLYPPLGTTRGSTGFRTHPYPTRTPLAEICGRSYPTRTPTVPHLYPNRTPIGFLNRAR